MDVDKNFNEIEKANFGGKEIMLTFLHKKETYSSAKATIV